MRIASPNGRTFYRKTFSVLSFYIFYTFLIIGSIYFNVDVVLLALTYFVGNIFVDDVKILCNTDIF